MVYINRIRKSKTPLRLSLLPGNYTVHMHLDGYPCDWTPSIPNGLVTVVAGQEIIVSGGFYVDCQTDVGLVYATSNPSRAYVSVSGGYGLLGGYTPVYCLPSGSNSFSLLSSSRYKCSNGCKDGACK
jgi:hypothetical protein